MCWGSKSQERERPRTCIQGSTLTRSRTKQSIALEHWRRSRNPFKENVYMAYFHIEAKAPRTDIWCYKGLFYHQD